MPDKCLVFQCPKVADEDSLFCRSHGKAKNPYAGKGVDLEKLKTAAAILRRSLPKAEPK